MRMAIYARYNQYVPNLRQWDLPYLTAKKARGAFLAQVIGFAFWIRMRAYLG